MSGGLEDEAGFALGAAPGDDDHAGHRRRVRERFLKVGGDALEDYELLELVLCSSPYPSRDTKAARQGRCSSHLRLLRARCFGSAR
jgi:hypothetical protein